MNKKMALPGFLIAGLKNYQSPNPRQTPKIVP